jgi:hypothetical protein
MYDSTYQVSINSNIPPFIGNFKLIELQSENMHSTIYNLQFVDSKNNTLYSEIIDTVEDFAYFPDFEFIDANFDGYLDLLTVIDRDAKAQPTYKFWLFDTQNYSFEFNQNFTDSLICNIEFMAGDSTISSGCQAGCMGQCGSQSTYKVMDNTLTLIKYTISEQVDVDGIEKIRTSTYKLINGNMKLVDEYYDDFE